MNLLGYFDAGQQTEAVLNLCNVARRAVYLFSGTGMLGSMAYDVASIRRSFPGCHVTIKNETTHHIIPR